MCRSRRWADEEGEWGRRAGPGVGRREARRQSSRGPDPQFGSRRARKARPSSEARAGAGAPYTRPPTPPSRRGEHALRVRGEKGRPRWRRGRPARGRGGDKRPAPSGVGRGTLVIFSSPPPPRAPAAIPAHPLWRCSVRTLRAETAEVRPVREMRAADMVCVDGGVLDEGVGGKEVCRREAKRSLFRLHFRFASLVLNNTPSSPTMASALSRSALTSQAAGRQVRCGDECAGRARGVRAEEREERKVPPPPHPTPHPRPDLLLPISSPARPARVQTCLDACARRAPPRAWRHGGEGVHSRAWVGARTCRGLARGLARGLGG